MIRDPIVEEIREARRKTEEAFGRDWKRLAEHYRSVPIGKARVIRRAPRKTASELPGVETETFEPRP